MSHIVSVHADLRVRISTPATGRDLPVVLFSHGYGSSLEAYGPLTDYWAERGFVVIQPGHRPGPDWRARIRDMTSVLDNLERLEERADPSRVAVAGHSFGGQTAGSLLGLRVLPEGEDFSDPRVRAGVLLATAGHGGKDLTPLAFDFMNPTFEHMTKPALIVAGDRDDSPLTHRGPDWLTDAYHHSPGPKSLLTVFGGEHSLGGIPGYDSPETTDADPARLAFVQEMTYAYLRDALDPDPRGVLISK